MTSDLCVLQMPEQEVPEEPAHGVGGGDIQERGLHSSPANGHQHSEQVTSTPAQGGHLGG